MNLPFVHVPIGPWQADFFSCITVAIWGKMFKHIILKLDILPALIGCFSNSPVLVGSCGPAPASSLAQVQIDPSLIHLLPYPFEDLPDCTFPPGYILACVHR